MITFRGSPVLVLALSAGVLTATACGEPDDAGTGGSAAQAPGYSAQGGAGFPQPGGNGGVVPSTGGAGGVAPSTGGAAGPTTTGGSAAQPPVVDSGTGGSTPGGAGGAGGGNAGTNPSLDASTPIPDGAFEVMDGQATTDDGGGTGGAGGIGGAGAGGAGTGGETCTNVRPTGTQWDEATCDQWASETSECSAAWMIDNHYCDESCGRCTPSGGAGGAGGTGGSGGTGGTTSTCTEPDQTVCNNGTGSHCGYTYEYWKDRGTGCLINTSDGFSVDWSNINNLLGRKGLRPGSMNQIVDYDAIYQPNGNSYLCVYGWTQNPLVEYYIVDSWGSWRPPGGEGHMGTVTSDGGTYDIYRTQRVNQPSIQGTATFYQYWSVRTEKRTSGTITVANHFDAWQSHGMNMGSLYEVSMCVEGYQSSGNADVSVSMR